MRKYLLIALFPFISLAAPPGQLRTNGTIQWDYPTNALSTNMVFKLYSHTNIAAPLSTWPLLSTILWTNSIAITNRLGTNRAIYQFTFPTVQAQQFFVVTASNWHGESDFSEVAQTVMPPLSDIPVRIGP